MQASGLYRARKKRALQRPAKPEKRGPEARGTGREAGATDYLNSFRSMASAMAW